MKNYGKRKLIALVIIYFAITSEFDILLAAQRRDINFGQLLIPMAANIQ